MVLSNKQKMDALISLAKRQKKFNKGKDIKASKSYVKRAINSHMETKYHDVDVTDPATITPVTGEVHDLANIPVGSTNITRIGNQITLTKLQIRCHLRTGISQPRGEYVRVMVVQQKNQNNTELTLAQILEPESKKVIQQYLYDNRQEYKILYDRVHRLAPGTEESQKFLNINLYKNLGRMSLVGTGSAANGKNKIQVYFLSSQPVEATGAQLPDYVFTSRLFYKDG